MRRQFVREAARALAGRSWAIRSLAGLLVTFGPFGSRNRTAHRPTDVSPEVAAVPVPVGSTHGAPAVPAPAEAPASGPTITSTSSTDAPHDPAADRRGLIRLVGQCIIEGRNRTAGGWGTDTWALLGLLAEYRSSLLTKSAAGDKLWPEAEAPHDRFAGLLKATRAKMCEALGMPGNYGRIVIQFMGSTGYRINPDLYTCDVWQIRDLLTTAARAKGPERSAALIAAADLYTGPYLPDVPHGWARHAADALNRAVVQALAQLADLEEQPEIEIGYLERATELDGVAEHLYRRRMEVYSGLGRFQAIHYCYDELHERLRARGRKPSSQTGQLYRRVTDFG
ncbi:AfsR/SARP family transcriptional regulator [Nonomuraea jiangxiensis]|uniref:DNA-binding transcriptional activator of the SARP family n=1 Tax=Nonomuraea jiangxiensis TaxID=633440 RepID=A0A1G9LNZ5_9ACTN|nr:bacterial transcriptional activator domain-containing protein [Nonomuraea jiangxiensis]SDL63752.1 DNA-binding transcriptional activator of the SARP family [Nonomuraea jiangxiensis]